jgi:hypothetical protein
MSGNAQSHVMVKMPKGFRWIAFGEVVSPTSQVDVEFFDARVAVWRIGNIRSFVAGAGLFFFVRLRFRQGAVAACVYADFKQQHPDIPGLKEEAHILPTPKTAMAGRSSSAQGCAGTSERISVSKLV